MIRRYIRKLILEILKEPGVIPKVTPDAHISYQHFVRNFQGLCKDLFVPGIRTMLKEQLSAISFAKEQAVAAHLLSQKTRGDVSLLENRLWFIEEKMNAADGKDLLERLGVKE